MQIPVSSVLTCVLLFSRRTLLTQNVLYPRFPTLSTSPLGISPKAGEIPTFPQLRRRWRMEKWNQKQVFHFPTASVYLSQNKKPRRLARERNQPQPRTLHARAPHQWDTLRGSSEAIPE